MIALDASVLIAQFDASDVHSATAGRLFAGWGDERLRASTITLGEVLVRHVQAGLVEEAHRVLRLLRIGEQPIPVGSGDRLAALRAATRLRLPDCCVLLAAQDAEADAIATFDDRLAEAAAGLGFAALPER